MTIDQLLGTDWRTLGLVAVVGRARKLEGPARVFALQLAAVMDAGDARTAGEAVDRLQERLEAA